MSFSARGPDHMPNLLGQDPKGQVEYLFTVAR